MALLLVALIACLLGALGALVAPRPLRAGLVGASGALASLLGLAGALSVLVRGGTERAGTTALVPFSGVHLALDPLGAWFLAVVSLVALSASLFHAGYAHDAATSRPASVLFVTFIATLLVVPCAGDVSTFFWAWEAMALSSLGLLLVEHERAAARTAGLWYAAMTQAGAACILLGLLVMSHDAHLSAIVGTPSAGRGALGTLAFALSALGFASKAGAVPLHVWLPRAHPEAPTPVSALMSGAMVALGVYGLIRVDLIDLAHASRALFVGLLLLGALSALFGALHAAAASDLKRLLAFSTIEVSGLGLIGVGAAGVMSAIGAANAARTLLIGVLVLVAAHGAFKALLFLGAGLIERSTGTRDLDQLGGLVHTMPRTSLLVGLGAASAVGVPLFGGFVGEWISLEGLVGAMAHRAAATVVVLLVGLVALALAGGLSAITFTKLIGIGLLGRSRSAGAASARDVSGAPWIALALLGSVSVALGVAPGLLVHPLERASRGLHGAPHVLGAAGAALQLGVSDSALRPISLLGILAVGGLVLVGARSRARRASAPWACGRDELSVRMQYTATSFAEPVQRVFADVLRPDVDVELSHEDESREIERVLTYQSRVDDAVERTLYRPAFGAVNALGARARTLANGSVHRYLAYGFLALLVVLVVVA